ncbi:helix-turn-helix domain-containing protein [Flavobacterium amniphilum]|uniref:helix-turn-helix domain-containing protein n=1 Tax=Flavobacterium amniphilum TaxID=1834035 RepID=UPI00202A2C33|nr:helix-turn-helix domain-containing protein [Flavobacterium amniphilum]MCL9804607.1 helix-turn-helix domain-containing protein [Flavobacterium amniphilum]
MGSKSFILILFSLTFSMSFAQKEVKKDGYDELRKLFFDNANNKSKQKVYAKAFLDKAKKENNNNKIIRGYYLHSLVNEKDKALIYLDSVIQYSINTDDENFPNSAYCEKAFILESQFKYKEALQNYLLAEKYAMSKKRIDDYYVARYYVAITKSESLGETKEALNIYKEIFNHYKKGDAFKTDYSKTIYQKAIFGIADSYKALKSTDSATYYNKLGYRETKKANNEQFLNLFILNEGANQILTKNYRTASDSIKKALPFLKRNNDKANIMASYYYLGQINQGQGNTNEALKNFIKVDSIHQKEKIMFPELIGGYHYLISYYKKTGNNKKQLEYLTKYISIDSAFQQSHNNMYKLLVKEYDIPHLFKEKEALIESLKDNNSLFLIISIILIIAVLGLLYYQYRLKKIYKERFQKIIIDTQKKITINDNKTQPTLEKKDTVLKETKTIKSKELNIAKDVEVRILKSLKEFERQKKYLKQGITLQSLAKDCNTNTVYLSKIINSYKEKKFSDYINDLRIDQCVLELQQDSEFLKYTIEAIATDFGFNNEDTFSIAFQKRMKLKPSFFINELKKMKESA